MPFLKDNPDGGDPLTATYSIKGPDYAITNLNHGDYTFPVDGWEWVEVAIQPLPVLPDGVTARRLEWVADGPLRYEALTPFGWIRLRRRNDGGVIVEEAPWTIVDDTYSSYLEARVRLYRDYLAHVLQTFEAAT